jgi:hypothetical protein
LITRFHPGRSTDSILSETLNITGQYNVPNRKNWVAVDSVAPALGEMYQITTAETHDIKPAHLRPLKRFFQAHINTGHKVKLIFIVLPYRFETYKLQKYIAAEEKIEPDKHEGTETEREGIAQSKSNGSESTIFKPPKILKESLTHGWSNG